MREPSSYEKTVGMTYQEAKDFLIKIGRWDENSWRDGFSIVAIASYYRKNLVHQAKSIINGGKNESN